jgi:hypothetical protein
MISNGSLPIDVTFVIMFFGILVNYVRINTNTLIGSLTATCVTELSFPTTPFYTINVVILSRRVEFLEKNCKRVMKL